MITRRKLITNTATLAAGALVPVVAMGKASTIERLLSEAVVNISAESGWKNIGTGGYLYDLTGYVYRELWHSKGGGDP